MPSPVRRKSRRRSAEEKYHDPTTIDPPVASDRQVNVFSDEEAAFLKAAEAYQSRYGRRFLTACEYLFILKDMGYHKDP